MDRIFCVRADFGKYTDNFVKGGYVAVGGFSEQDLTDISDRGQLEDIHSSVSPDDARNILVRQQLDQIARFLFELKAGDFVITPSLNTEHIYFGVVQPEPNYYYDEVSDTARSYIARELSGARRLFPQTDFQTLFETQCILPYRYFR